MGVTRGARRAEEVRIRPALLRSLALLALALTAPSSTWAAFGDAVPMPPAATATAAPGLGKPPFDAWLDANAYWPRRSAERGALAAGVLRRGDTVRVIGCTPRCDLPRALGIVAGGAVVPLRLLRPLPMPADLARSVDFDALIRGRVRAWRAKVYAAPRTGARVLRTDRLGYLVAFVADPEAPEGWLRRWQGGWMRASDVKLLEPSDFHGVDAPTLPMAFTIHRIRPREIRGASEPAEIPYHSHFANVSLRAGRVWTADGRGLPRWKTRVAWPRARPARIAADALWAHVDLDEQTMVVYRGDTPLRATLVSTGKPGTSTRPGLYRVLSKVRMSTMSGTVPERYVAEAVPFVMHFYQGQALHGAWWHGGFGSVRSHGCVNLPLADARWLFEQAPPEVPKSWRGVLLSHGDPRLTLLIEKKTPRSKRQLREPVEVDDQRCVQRGPGSSKRDCPFDAFEGNDAD